MEILLLGIFFLIIVLIAHGSLYPWAFEAHPLNASPLYILLHSWGANPAGRRLVFDVAVNIAIYIPLGISGYLAFRRFSPGVIAVLAPIGAGTLLSASMEMLQLYTPNRQCSSIDLVDNILGTVLGVIAGIAFVWIVDIPSAGPALPVRDRGAVALLVCWVSFLLFPVFPVLWLAVWKAKLSAFSHASPAQWIPMLLSAAQWFAARLLLAAAGAKRPLRWFLVALLLLPVQFGIVSRAPLPSEWEGAAIALAACLWLRGTARQEGLAGVVLLAAVVLRGLTPFHFESPARAFLWMPFVGLLSNEWQNSMVILLGKLFQYGASIWLLGRTRLGLLRATVLVAVVLAVIEALQTHIPGHVAEINDPLLAVLLGFGFYALRSAALNGQPGRVV